MKDLVFISTLLFSSNVLAIEKQDKIDNLVERQLNLHVGFKAGVCHTLSEQAEHFTDASGQLNMPLELLKY